jgi:uncharacterized protein involved in exopolysaccharide biosynthesis
MRSDENHFDDTGFVSIRDLVAALAEQRKLFFSIVLVSLILSVTYAFTASKLYRASVDVVPVQRQSESAGLLSGLGGLGDLASFAGIRSEVVSLKEEALATIRSKEFLFAFIEDHNLLPLLYSSKYDSDSSVWDVKSDDDIPTLWDGYRKLRKSILRIHDDDLTGLVTLSVEWKDRFVAAEWANEIIWRINAQMRARDIEESEKRIEFLMQQLESTGIVELERSIFRLVELEVNNIMVANVRQEYAFRVVDPAIAPDADRYFFPRLVVIVPVGLIIGIIFAGFLVMVRRLFWRPETRKS